MEDEKVLINTLKTKMDMHNIRFLVYLAYIAAHFLLIILLYSTCLTEQPCTPALSRGFFMPIVVKSSVT